MAAPVQTTAAAGALRLLLRSSIGQKLVIALAGLALCSFLVVHLWGNLLLFAGNGKLFNDYAAFLGQSTLLIPAEVILASIFLTHMGFAIYVTLGNRRARPMAYARHEAEGGRTIASATMIYTGLLGFAFLVMHVINFRLGSPDPVAADGSGGLHLLVITHFRSFFATALYIIAVCLIGLHVSHGVQSAARTLGLVHPKYTPVLEKLSLLFGVVTALGFASIAIWAFVGGGPYGA